MTIQELMEKRAKVWEAAKNFVDTHENENGVLSAEDSAAYERMESEIEDLTKAIDRHRKAEEMEKNLNQPVNQPLTGKPYAGGQGEPKTGRASDEYRRAMLNALRSNFRQVSNLSFIIQNYFSKSFLKSLGGRKKNIVSTKEKH